MISLSLRWLHDEEFLDKTLEASLKNICNHQALAEWNAGTKMEAL